MEDATLERAADPGTSGSLPLLWRAAGSAASAVGAIEVCWHASLERIEVDAALPKMTVAHEFLDALPVHQLVRAPRGWHERMVDLREHAEKKGVEARGAEKKGAEARESATQPQNVWRVDGHPEARPTGERGRRGRRSHSKPVANPRRRPRPHPHADATCARVRGVKKQTCGHALYCVPVRLFQ